MNTLGCRSAQKLRVMAVIFEITSLSHADIESYGCHCYCRNVEEEMLKCSRDCREVTYLAKKGVSKVGYLLESRLCVQV